MIEGPSQRIPVGVLGATGAVGQRMVSLLTEHPWFDLIELVASERSAGKRYGDAVSWRLSSPLPPGAARLLVQPLAGGVDADAAGATVPRERDLAAAASAPSSPSGGALGDTIRAPRTSSVGRPRPARMDEPPRPPPGATIVHAPFRSRILFSALDSDVAGEAEERLASAGYAVVSNSKNHRLDRDVPLVIPEVNGGHLRLLAAQKERRGSAGFIVTNPNCSATGLTMALAPLDAAFGVESLVVATLQAVSGAGYPGLPSMDILDNAVPYIEGEEEKIEREPLKMLGRLAPGDGSIEEAGFPIVAMVHRVPVVDGHMVSALVRIRSEVSPEAAARAWRDWSREHALDLPSAPEEPLLVLEQADRPQTRLDRDAGRGMTTTVGRLRRSAGGGLRFTCVAHNTLRGAAGAAVLNAELLVREGLLS